MDRHSSVRTGGTEGSQFREYKLRPFLYFPVDCRVMLPHAAQHQPLVDPAVWPEIAERARYTSLRDLAAEYGVSHETIRTIVRRLARKEPATAEA